MDRAIAQVERRLRRHVPDARVQFALVDGSPVPELCLPHKAIVKGDARCLSIAAGSVVAKDCRDHLMERLADRYPAYACWRSDRGYPSPRHMEALQTVGPIPGHHRESFAPVARLVSHRR